MAGEGETLRRRSDAKLDMFAESQGLTIGSADTRVVGGNMFSTTYSYTNNVFQAAPADSRIPAAVPHTSSNAHDQVPAEPSFPWRPPEVQTVLHRILRPFWIYPRNSSTGGGDFAVSPLDDGSDIPAVKKTPGEVYVFTMLHTGKGLPCWKPSPRRPLRDGEGVVPGDVGIFSVEGGFRKRFNLWDNERSIQESPASKVYKIQYHAPSKPRLYVKPNELAEGKALARGVWYETIYEPDNETIARFEFHHLESHQQGAVLAMTSPGKLEELDDSDGVDLREFISKYAGLLYRYADAIRPIDKHEALYVVTGSIKSENWALAAFQDPVMQPGHVPKLVRLSNSKPHEPVYAWRSPGTFDSYVGTTESNTSQDQALFLRGFKLAASSQFREQLRQGSTFHDSHGLGGDAGGPPSSDRNEDNPNDDPDQHSGGSTGGSKGDSTRNNGHSNRGNQAADDCFVVTSFPDEFSSESCHPCDRINNVLLEKTGLDFALSHDNDWRSVLGGPDCTSAPIEPLPNEMEKLQPSVISIRHGVASFSIGGGNVGLPGGAATALPVSLNTNEVPTQNIAITPTQASSESPSTLPPFEMSPRRRDRGGSSTTRSPTTGHPSPSSPDPPRRGRETHIPIGCNVCSAKKVRCEGRKPVCVNCENWGRQSDCSFPPQRSKPQHEESLRRQLEEAEQHTTYLLSELERCRKEHGSAASPPTILLEGPILSGDLSEGDENDNAADGDDNGSTRGLVAPIQRLELSQGRTLIAYGSTSVFRFQRNDAPQPGTHSPPADIQPLTGRYTLLSEAHQGYNDLDLDWCRYLPHSDTLSRLEHDKVLDLLFKFATSWCLRVIPSLFLRDMHLALSTPKSQAQEAPRLAHYSPMLHNAVLSVALAFSDDPTLRDYKTRSLFADESKKYLESECSRPNLAAVNALSILATHHSSQGDQTLGFMYAGMSARMTQALGLELDCRDWVARGVLDKADVRDRNWAYWMVFTQDVDWSLYVGRDFCLRAPSEEAFRDLSAAFLDSEFDNLPFHHPPSGLPAQPSNSSKLFASTCKLFSLSRGIMGLVNGVSKGKRTSRPAVEGLLNDIHSQLHTWKATLPPEVELTATNRSSAPPHKLMLHMAYWWLLILLHRPYLHQGHDTTHNSEKALDHAKTCKRSADQIMDLLTIWRQLYTLRYVPVTVVQPLFAAGTIHILHGVQAASGTRLAIRELTSCLDSLKLAIEYLQEIGASWQSALKIEVILKSLVEQELLPAIHRHHPVSSLGRHMSRKASASSIRSSSRSNASQASLGSPTVYSPTLYSPTLYSPTLGEPTHPDDFALFSDDPIGFDDDPPLDAKEAAPGGVDGSPKILPGAQEATESNHASRAPSSVEDSTKTPPSAKPQLPLSPQGPTNSSHEGGPMLLSSWPFKRS